MSKVISRFAPSPTTIPDAAGKHHGLHLGGARSALFAYLLAKSQGGTFIIRSEDTDKVRSSKESEDSIIESLRWLGITSDIPIIRQSERGEIYQQYLDALLESGKAYKCYCTVEELDAVREEQKAEGLKALYNRKCYGKPERKGEPYVVRLKVPDFGRVKINDKVLGRIQVNNTELSDPILQRTDGSFCFLFVNCLDDALQGVTHVLRGQDGISHCHSQVLLCEAMGFEPPVYAHVPFVLGEDGQKLSKRNGAKSVLDLRDEGYLPEAVLNAMVRIGCSFGAKEILSLEEMVAGFDVKHLNKAPGVFDPKKFEHVNKHWIKVGDPVRIAELLEKFIGRTFFNAASVGPDGNKAIRAVKTLQTRSTTLKDMAEQAKFYFDSNFVPERRLTDEEKLWLTVFTGKLENSSFSPENLQKSAEEACEVCNIKINQLFPAARMALAGRACSPGVVEMLEVFGFTEAKERFKKAITSA